MERDESEFNTFIPANHGIEGRYFLIRLAEDLQKLAVDYSLFPEKNDTKKTNGSISNRSDFLFFKISDNDKKKNPMEFFFEYHRWIQYNLNYSEVVFLTVFVEVKYGLRFCNN